MAKLIGEEIEFEGPRFNVVRKTFEREDGKVFLRDIVNPRGGCCGFGYYG
ncbi:MAG: hypothetical protein IJ867_04460 [Clostridia bacterium]|nr:hypothetical protein [Clostridia bacterium]